MKLYTADAIKEQVHKLLCQDCGETEYCPKCDYRELIEQILDAPTVDAEPVVRCKDCKYWEYDVIFSDGWCRGKHQGNPSWFCADGERKEDA